MEENNKYYLVIENEKIIGRTTNPSLTDIEVTEFVYNDYKQDPEKYIYSGGKIKVNPDYAEIIARRRKEEQRENILSQIEQLDKKRIRAVCEPSIKDETTGETWLEYYNAQIENLREQLNNLGLE